MKTVKKMMRMLRLFAEYRGRKDVLTSLPMRIWIETTNRCNLRCVMCPNKDMLPAQKGLMSMDLFKKIIDECKSFVGDVNLHHRGEPLLNPELPAMIRYANEAGLKTRFHSNGALLTEERALALLDAAPSLLSFSIDGFTKASYEQVRVGAEFEKTCENVMRLARLRRERGQQKPYIVVERIRFGNDAGADAAAIAAMTRRFEEAGVDEVIEKEEYVWAQAGTPEGGGPRRYAVCTFPWYAMVICWDGTVTPCPQDFDAVMSLGNVRDQSIREVWNGPAYRDLRKRFATDVQSLPLCRKCDRLARKTVAGVPLQYMATFLVDQVLGYGRLRRALGTQERNS